MNENEFELNGVTYVATAGDTCHGCAFDKRAADESCRSYLPSCIDADRRDGRFVIFVEKQK